MTKERLSQQQQRGRVWRTASSLWKKKRYRPDKKDHGGQKRGDPGAGGTGTALLAGAVGGEKEWY